MKSSHAISVQKATSVVHFWSVRVYPPFTMGVTDVGIQPKYMTGADWRMGWELAGLGLVLTGTGAVSALGWSVTQKVGAARALMTLAESSVLWGSGQVMGD
jgi:hypothetical protein